MVLRAEVGRLSGAGVPRRRRGGPAVAQRQGTRPLLPGAVQALRDELVPRCVLDGEVVVPREIGGRIRLDWESLCQRIHPAASRVKMLAEQTPGALHRFRRAGHRRQVADGRAVPRPSASAVRSDQREAVVPRHPHHRGPRSGRAVAQHVRGRRPGRGDRQEAGRAVPAGQAGDGQGQTRPRRRLRGHRLPHPQERRGCRVDPARPVPRRRRTADGRRRSVVHRQGPAEAAGRPGAAAQGRRHGRRRAQPMELGGRQALDPGAAGEGRRGGLRPDGGKHHARPAFPPRCAVRALAARPRSQELHLRPARRAAELRPVRRAGVA